MKKIAVVGFGFMGLTHTLNILKNDILKLVAIVDKDPEMIQNATAGKGNIDTGNIDIELLKGIRKYSRFDECLKNEDIDAVSICVPTVSHFNLAKMALENGKHVFLEKPMCVDILQANELVNLANRIDRVMMTAHVVRFMPAYQKLKEFVGTGEFGKLKFLSLNRFCGRPGWGDWTNKEVASESGGALFDLVIHDIDFANWLLGSPDEIECRCLPGQLSKHDYINAMWRYDKMGITVKIEGGNNFHGTMPFQSGYIADFEKASISFTSLDCKIIKVSDDQETKEIQVAGPETGYYNEINYFASCIEKNMQPFQCMPSSTLRSLELCHRHL